MIEDITEYQQLRLFELVYAEYIKDSVRFYHRYKKADAVSWNKLHPLLRDVFVEMKYQGVLSREMVTVFGGNKKEAVIRLIKESPILLRGEAAGNRIPYIKGVIK